MSRYAGPQEGIYTIHPRHMSVNKPRNANDEDLEDGMGSVELPLTHPTSMSYFLHRIRLGELCRELTDRFPLSISDPGKMLHAQITEIDTAFEDFIEGVPAFFKLDSAGLEQIPKTDPRRTPGVTVQRYILNSLMYAHRCKLHLHYLGRGPEDPMRTRSREKCLSSARIIIRTERILEKEDIPFVLTRFKFSGVLFCIFMAVIVLLLDVCLDEGAQHDEARKAEVMDAFSILEEARKESPIAVKLIESLMSVVRKHRVSLPTSNRLQDESRPPSTGGIGIVTPAATEELGVETGTSNLGSQGPPDLGLSCLDEIWQSFDGQMDFDTLFSAIDAQFN